MSRKNSLTIIICTILVSTSLFGQKSLFHYKPIHIRDSSVQWIYVQKDTMFKPNNPVGNLKLTPYSNLIGPYHVLIHDNSLFAIYYSWFNSTEGIYIRKTNLNFGISEGMFTWDKRSNGGIRERYENAFFRLDGTLEILSSRMPAKKFTPQLGVISLDTSDLTKINHSFSPFSDTNTIRLASIYSTQHWLPLTIPLTDSIYINYQRYYEQSKHDTSLYYFGIKAVTIDNKGRYISDTSALYFERDISLPLSYKYNNQQKLFQNRDGSITYLQYYHYDNDSIYAELFHFDQELNIIARHDLAHLFNKHEVFSYIQNTTDDHLIVMVDNFIDGVPFSQYSTAMIIDRRGNLIEKIKLLEFNDLQMINPVVTKIAGLQGSLIFSSAFVDYRLDIWNTQSDGNLRLLKSFEFEQGYYMAPSKVVELPNDELLLFTYYIRDTLVDETQKQLLYASAVIKFNREDLGLPTSSHKVITSPKFSFICSPNPASDRVELDFKRLFKGRLEIVNNQGRIIESHVVNQQKIYNLSISHWTAGIYHINAYTQGHRGESFGSVKLVKK